MKSLTKRNILMKAMPLFTLSNSQWSAIQKHIDKVEETEGAGTELFNALQTLQTNQAKIEVMGDYFDYYGRNLDDPVREEGIQGLQIM